MMVNGGVRDDGDTTREGRRKRARGLFEKCNGYQGKQHTAYMRMCKKLKSAQDDLEEAVSGHAATDDAWNKNMLRGGDMIGDTASVNQDAFHPNAYRPEAILHNAFRMIGKGRMDRSGVRGSVHGMSMSISVACAFRSAQRDWFAERLHHMSLTCSSLCIQRQYDATPWRLRFGGLQSKLYPHARYIMRDSTQSRWILVDSVEFAKRTKGKIGRFGVMEVLAQGLRVQGVGRGDEILHGARLMLPPTILQRGNSSTIHSAVERACPELAHDRLVEICGRVPYVWLNEKPDAHSANQRKRAKSLRLREGIPNCFDVPGTCADHQAHRCIASREPGVIGNLYALAWCGAAVRIQSRFQHCLWKLVCDDLDAGGWICAKPDKSWAASNESMLAHTLLREEGWRCSEDDDFDLDDHPVKPVRQFLNGDWRRDRIVHYCLGSDCCRDLEHAKTNVYAALLGSDVTFSDETKIPSIDNWGTCGASSGRALFGFACHRVLPRMVQLAFPHFERNIEHGDDVDAATIIRAKTVKKANRVKAWIEDSDALLHLLAYSINGVHVERLMKSLDAKDQVPFGVYALFRQDTNPFIIARTALAKELQHSLNPDSTLHSFVSSMLGGGQALVRSEVGRARLAAAHAAFKKANLDIGAQVWWRFLLYELEPISFLCATAPRVDDRSAFARYEAAFGRRSCCNFKGTFVFSCCSRKFTYTKKT